MSFTIKPGDYEYLYCLATRGQSYAPIADIEQEILDIYRYVRISKELGKLLKANLRKCWQVKKRSRHQTTSFFRRESNAFSTSGKS